MALVCGWGLTDTNFSTVGKRQVDAHVKEPTFALMVPWWFQAYMTRRQAAVHTFQVGNVIGDLALQSSAKRRAKSGSRGFNFTAISVRERSCNFSKLWPASEPPINWLVRDIAITR